MSAPSSTNFAEDQFFIADRALRHLREGGNRRQFLSYDDPGTADDVEILAKVLVTSRTTGERWGPALRGSGTNGSENAYVAQIRIGTGLQFVKYVSGTFTEIAAVDIAASNSTHYWVRFRAEGTALKAKSWRDGEDEPAGWQIEETDASLSSAGWIGLFSFQSTGESKYCDYFSFDTDGGTAPGPGDTPGMDQGAVDFDGQTVGNLPADWSPRWGEGFDSGETVFNVQRDGANVPPFGWNNWWGQLQKWTIEEVSGTGGDHVMRLHDIQTNAYRVAAWHEAGVHEDVDVTLRLRSATGGTQLNNRFGPAICIGGEHGNRQAYHLSARSDSLNDIHNVRLYRQQGTTPTVLAEWPIPIGLRFSVDEWIFLRLQKSGTTIRGRYWKDGDPQPETWQIEETDATFSSGFVGIVAFAASPNNKQFDTFSILIPNNLTGDHVAGGAFTFGLVNQSVLNEITGDHTAGGAFTEGNVAQHTTDLITGDHIAGGVLTAGLIEQLAGLFTFITGDHIAGGVVHEALLTALDEQVGIHVIYQAEGDSFWLDQYAGRIGPYSSLTILGNTPQRRRLLLGGDDGRIRWPVENARTDDGYTIRSHWDSPPLEAADGDAESIVTELAPFAHELSGEVEWYWFTADSADEVRRMNDPAQAAASGTMFATGGFQEPIGLRIRGGAHKLRIVQLRDDATWAMERLRAEFFAVSRRRVQT
jgi:hypothetical protein